MLMGLIAHIVGTPLQDDIVRTTDRLLRLGQDMLVSTCRHCVTRCLNGATHTMRAERAAIDFKPWCTAAEPVAQTSETVKSCGEKPLLKWPRTDLLDVFRCDHSHWRACRTVYAPNPQCRPS